MTEQEILNAIRENDIAAVRALLEKDDAQALIHREEGERLRSLLAEVRNAAAN